MEHILCDSSGYNITEYKLPKLVIENIFDQRFHVMVFKELEVVID